MFEEQVFSSTVLSYTFQTNGIQLYSNIIETEINWSLLVNNNLSNSMSKVRVM